MPVTPADIPDQVPMNPIFCWSLDRESYYRAAPSDTREAAFKDGLRHAVTEEWLSPASRPIVWTAVAVPFAPSIRSSYALLDSLQDDAFEHAGEAADQWLVNLSPEARADLNTRLAVAFEQWMDAHDQRPSFFGVEDAKERRATEQEVADAIAEEVARCP